MDRYLHFDNIDMRKPDVSSQCSRCGQRFEAELKPGERVDDVLLRIRAHFDSHLRGGEALLWGKYFWHFCRQFRVAEPLDE
jgi:hypothetical protein